LLITHTYSFTYFASDMLQWRLWVDWPNDTDIDYRCQPDEQPIAVSEVSKASNTWTRLPFC